MESRSTEKRRGRQTAAKPRERCVWCHRTSSSMKRTTVTLWGYFAVRRYEATFAVHPDHEAPFCAYAERFERHGRLFFVLLVLLACCLLAVPLAGALDGLGDGATLTLAGGLMAGGGVLLVVFPFCTPSQVHGLSLRGARRLLCVVGGTDLALGAALAAVGFAL